VTHWNVEIVARDAAPVVVNEREVHADETRHARDGDEDMFIWTWKFWTPKRPVESSNALPKMNGGSRSFSVDCHRR
jgi:hypothetical protein